MRKEGNASFESGKFAHAAQTYSAALKARCRGDIGETKARYMGDIGEMKGR